MNLHEISARLLSNMPQEIWAGCWDIVRLSDREVLRLIAVEVLPARSAIKSVDLGGGLRSNSIALEHALRKLFVALSEKCLCSIYAGSSLYDPKKEFEAGLIVITSEHTDPGTWQSTSECSCLACDANFKVCGEAGGHLPIWTWVQENNPV